MYISDLGLKRHITNQKSPDLGHSLENIVFFEFKKRGNRVYIGSGENSEVDFIAKGDEGVRYYQVTASMLEKTTVELELKALNRIRDNYPKTILTLDDYSIGDYEGIKVENILSWLLDGH